MEPDDKVITAEMLKLAMEAGLGPLTGKFESYELQKAHDLWIKGSEMIKKAESLILEYERCPW